MVVRVGINGFGRIGRIIFRTCLQNNDIELSAVNDPAITAEYICYLIKFDSTHGKFSKSVNYVNDEITVEDHIIKIFHEKMPSSVPWHTVGVQYVIEASGMFTTLEKASGHIHSNGIRRVLVTAPSVDVPMVILGVNEFILRSEHKVLSCASSTLYCLAPIIKVLEDQFGISEGFVTSIHAMTPSLKPLDGLCLRGKHRRDHRSILQNIIPATTGACKALGKIIPQVKDKMSGLAFRVPIVNVSVLDITIRHKSNTTLQDIVTYIEKASNTHMKNILKISRDETVSSDYIGESHSCIFDSESSLQLKSNFYKLICWYENEYSYACRVIDSIFFSERQLSLVSISSKMTYMKTKPSKKYDVDQQTDCLSKEISVECKHNADLCKSSQETFGFKPKELHGNAIHKKQLSAHISGMPSSSTGGRETKKRNEIFKIWNDCQNTSKSGVRQNRELFFHSCISFNPPHIQYNNMKENQHLQNGNRDISIKTNTTDEMLKQNCSNKVDEDIDKTFSPGEVNEKVSITQKISRDKCIKKCNQKSHKIINVIRSFDISGDYENRMKVADSKALDGCSKEEPLMTYNSSNSKEINDNSLIAEIDSSIQEADKLFTKRKPHNNSHKKYLREVTKHRSKRIKAVENESKLLGDDNAFKKQVAKAINNLIDGFEQSFHVSCEHDHKNSRKKDSFQVKQDFKPNCTKEAKYVENIRTSDVDNKHNTEIIEKENIFLRDNHNRRDKLKETKYLNTAIETKYKVIHLNNKLYKKQIVQKPADNMSSNETNKKDDTYFAKEILDGLNTHPDPVAMIRGDKTRSTSLDNMNGFKNFIVTAPKQDIFDKLDSVSETDSENSFEIHRRKSQVIHIKDLTKSLEDLTNLDKICRIIEISDELSDKLFSTLGTVDDQVLMQKEWSFKDLCQRIKLDEFCNKVFGKTAL